MTINSPFRYLVCIALCLGICFAGCEHGEKGSGFTYGDSSLPKPKPEDEKEPAKNNPFTGTWKLTATADGFVWYAHFNANGSWRISNNSDGSQQRVNGSYKTNGNQLTGNMVNPNVGTGEIKASISGGRMTLDFIEHWHTPHKTVHYTGSKL